ncbi:MAG: ATP-binding protein [Lachnospiraceae bacterium]|nr:ATP-binding protein [Candidatus Colinaster scatohippi]
MRENELIVYKNFEDGGLLHDMAFLMEHYKDEYYYKEDLQTLFYDCMHSLLEMAGNHGFSGNLWHCYLTNLLVNNENSYSRSTEIVGNISGTINDAVLHDIKIFKEFYDYDFSDMVLELNLSGFELIQNYKASTEESKVYNDRIRKRICTLAEKFCKNNTPEEMKDTLTEFYHDYGVGKFGLHKAFRVTHNEKDETEIVPILNIAHVNLDDLVGYEIPKSKLIENTEAFVSGRKANNCLLFGDAGTGKSSSIKAIANAYYDRGLRIIEIYKHQFKDLNDVIAQIKNRNYKFIIYMDDLSFEEFEIEYKYLKAVIEGGLEKKPKNVLIYATSNRRHLVNEKFSDREDSMHINDTMQEKMSLVSRFGCTIYFGSPEKKEYQNIVKVLADRNKINMPEEELLAEANKWQVAHGGLSGRSAQQFIDYLLGKEQ